MKAYTHPYISNENFAWVVHVSSSLCSLLCPLWEASPVVLITKVLIIVSDWIKYLKYVDSVFYDESMSRYVGYQNIHHFWLSWAFETMFIALKMYLNNFNARMFSNVI